jgi:hypothetical protein
MKPGPSTFMDAQDLEELAGEVIEFAQASTAADPGLAQTLLLADETRIALATLADVGLDARVEEPLGNAEARFEEAFDAFCARTPEDAEELLVALPAAARWWADRLRAERDLRLEAAADRLISMRAPLRDAIGTMLDRWGQAVYASAAGMARRGEWLREARRALAHFALDAPPLLETLLVDRVYCEAEAGATSLTEISDRETAVTRLLGPTPGTREVAAEILRLFRESSAAAVSDVLDVFVPKLDADAAALPRGVFLTRGTIAALAEACGAGGVDVARRRVAPPAAATANAACLDLGSFADPIWFVREREPLRDALTEVHEVGHVLTACAVRRSGPRRWLGLLPDLLAETLAYLAEVTTVRHDERAEAAGALTETLRTAAIDAIGAVFADELYPLVEEAEAGAAPSGEHVAKAWRAACETLGLDWRRAPASSFLLLPGIGTNQDLCRTHLLAHSAALALGEGGLDASIETFARLARSWPDADACAALLKGRLGAFAAAEHPLASARSIA